MGGEVDLYSYVLNNPLSRTDPTGLESEECEDLRKAIEEIKKLIGAAFLNRNAGALGVLHNQLDDLQAEYDEKCEEPPPDGGGQPKEESCPLSDPYKQAARPDQDDKQLDSRTHSPLIDSRGHSDRYIDAPWKDNLEQKKLHKAS